MLAGLPGTGKTTIARLLAPKQRAAHLRVDAVEAAMKRCGHTTESIGAAGYVVVQEIAASCLAVGTPVVIDAVSPAPEARQGWRALAEAADEHLVTVEVDVSDEGRASAASRGPRQRHRRPHRPHLGARRRPRLLPWDETRDGRRLRLFNDADPATSLDAILAYVDREQRPRS